MEQVYAQKYRELHENHWWWRAREGEVLRQVETRLGNFSRPAKILDVGCGDGLFFDELQKYGHVTGGESDPKTLSEDGKWLDRIHVQKFDSSFNPDEKYDAILMLDMLEHMEDPASAVKHAKSLLKEDGFLLATVPAFMSLWTSHDDLNHHVIRYRQEDFCPLIVEGGLKVQESRYLFHWTFLAKHLVRLKERYFGSVPKPPAVPNKILNTALEALTKLEQTTLSKLPVPFGSSLMVVATP